MSLAINPSLDPFITPSKYAPPPGLKTGKSGEDVYPAIHAFVPTIYVLMSARPAWSSLMMYSADLRYGHDE